MFLISYISRWLVIVLLVAFVLSGRLPKPEHRFEARVRQIERQDRRSPPPRDAVLFVGSSSIRMWDKLDAHFPNVPIIQRGFGGMHMVDVLLYSSRMIIPYEPRLVIVYAGENDLAEGKAPERVARQFEKLVAGVNAELPEVEFAFVAIKPSVARRDHMGAMNEANQLIRELADRDPRVFFVDVWSPMLGQDGEPRPELFLNDSLHLNAKGYALWRRVIAPYIYDCVDTSSN